MSARREVFASSLARSGSYVISMMLSTNPEVTIASEPFLELFRSLRNAIVRHEAAPDLLARSDATAPIQDHYFTDDRIALMDAVMRGDLDVPTDPVEWEGLLPASIERARLQCAELVPHLNEMRGHTYKEVFDRALDVIARARAAERRRWVGIKDAWIVDLFPALARSYDRARFVIILRDPRAVIHSMLGAGERLVAHALSYARHWRKYVACALRFRADPLFRDRLYVVTHEAFLRRPEAVASELCDFLEVPYHPDMLDTDNYIDHATGRTWRGNSSFEDVTSGIRPERAVRWRTGLDRRIVDMIDLVCGPDMVAAGYEPERDLAGQWPPDHVLAYLIESDRAYAKWRTDLRDPQRDHGYELFRRALLRVEPAPQDDALVRRSFLFRDVYDRLREGRMIADLIPPAARPA